MAIASFPETSRSPLKCPNRQRVFNSFCFFKDGKQSQEAKVDSGGIAGGMWRKALVMETYPEDTIAVSKPGATRSREWMHRVMRLLEAAVGQLQDLPRCSNGVSVTRLCLVRPRAPRRVIDTAGLSSAHGTAICAGICPLSIAIPFTATEVRRLRVLGVRNQERSETIRSLAGYPS